MLAPEARVALTLCVLGGLTTAEIARAFLVPEPTVAQRSVRAKRALARERAAFQVPSGAARAARVSSVLQVIYLIFNEGYTATSGSDWMRPALCEDALRLGRILAELTPGEPEVHGLEALMEIQSSRSSARVGPGSEPVLLRDQNRGRWDQFLIRRGLAALELAMKIGGAQGPFVLQASIAACHARARAPEETDWALMVTPYEKLAETAPSPVVELNRAVAVGMAFGAQAGLELVEAISSDPSLSAYHLLPSVRGDFLWKLGRGGEARAEFERAASAPIYRPRACMRQRPSSMQEWHILDMLIACKYVLHMKMIQIRNVPDELHRSLKARAAMEGTSLSDYLRVQIQAIAERPTLAELKQRLESRSRVRSKESAAAAVRAEREAR